MSAWLLDAYSRIVSYTLGAGTATPLTLIAKGYHEFDAEHTFEGDVIDAAASFKF